MITWRYGALGLYAEFTCFWGRRILLAEEMPNTNQKLEISSVQIKVSEVSWRKELNHSAICEPFDFCRWNGSSTRSVPRHEARRGSEKLCWCKLEVLVVHKFLPSTRERSFVATRKAPEPGLWWWGRSEPTTPDGIPNRFFPKIWLGSKVGTWTPGCRPPGEKIKCASCSCNKYKGRPRGADSRSGLM